MLVLSGTHFLLLLNLQLLHLLHSMVVLACNWLIPEFLHCSATAVLLLPAGWRGSTELCCLKQHAGGSCHI